MSAGTKDGPVPSCDCDLLWLDSILKQSRKGHERDS